MRILIENFDRFYDRATQTEFLPVQDLRIGCAVGIAQVDDEAGANLLARPGNRFREVTDEEFLAMTTVKRPAPRPASVTGDPLAEGEEGKSILEGAPAPPTEGGKPRAKKVEG